MSDPEAQSQALLDAPVQETAPAQGGRSTRAYKVAGLTLLACVLVMSQAMIVYFLVNQKSDIKSLREQGSDLREQLAKGRSASVQIPMRPAAAINTLTFEEESSTGATETVPVPGTQCQQEASGQKKLSVPGFYPECDGRGLYLAQQCYLYQCWCVDPLSGEQIPGSLHGGQANCIKAKHAGRMGMMQVPDVSA